MLRTAFIKFCALGLGIGFALALCLGVWAWYAGRPKSPKPWDTKSLTAEFEYVNANEGELTFGYAFTNNTDFDYSLSSESQVSLTIKEIDGPVLTDAARGVTPKVPFFLPARHKKSFEIQWHGSPPFKEPQSRASEAEWVRYRAELKAYLNNPPLNSVDGFVMFDPISRYEVVLPPGWKSK